MKYADNSERPFLVEMIRSTAHNPNDEKLKTKIEKEMLYPGENDGLLDILPANKWMELERGRSRPKMLFGSFWMQGELCILFADTNIGKSILAVQLGDSISRHQHINGFELEAGPTPVLYVDFELSSQQFEARYSDSGGNYRFASNFYRAEVNLQAQAPKHFASFTDFMSHTLHRAIKNTGAEVLIIDNITCLGGNTERSAPALAMMKQLKLLKTHHRLSILVLAHTPKRVAGQPIGRNDLGGSKMLINFADSAIAMAESGTSPGCRYLKQVKQRSSKQVYGDDNVCLLKPERQGGFLGFAFIGNAPECMHLLSPAQIIRKKLAQQANSLYTQNHTQRQIAQLLKISVGTVNKLLREEGS